MFINGKLVKYIVIYLYYKIAYGYLKEWKRVMSSDLKRVLYSISEKNKM